MHPHIENTLPNADNVELIQSFIDIETEKYQSSKVMDFPPIDHDNPIKWVMLSHAHYIYMLKILQKLTHSYSEYNHTKQIFFNFIHDCFLVELVMGPRGARCTASTSAAGCLRDGYFSQIWRVGGGMFDLIPT